jgi:broad specificity phosphatase PhoE
MPSLNRLGTALVLGVLWLTAVAPLRAQTVILVRHAEKAQVPGNDPPLSETGMARARALQVALQHANVRHVIVTSRQRTTQTAARVIAAQDIQPVVIPFGDGDSAQVAAVATAVRRIPAGDAVLVVGHSNTVPPIIAALGGPKLPDLCDASYSTIFVLELGSSPKRLVRAHYGAPDPPGADSCSTQMETH